MTVRSARIGDIVALQRRVVEVDLAVEYTEIGVRSFGRGLFLKPPVAGAELGAKRVFTIKEGDLVVSNVFAWEGAVAVAGAEHADRIGSHRFMTWTPRADDVQVNYLRHYFGSERGLAQLREASPGSAGLNRTLSISNFEAIEVPLPDLPEQRRIAAWLDRVAAQVGTIAEPGTPDLRPSMPRLTEQLFAAAHLPRVRLEALCTNVNRTIHPGDDRGGAEDFVGLEHIEGHTGRALGSRPLGNEKGRKLRFESGDITFGYLRPYQNKVWAADRTGLCSVEQYVLVPEPGVDPELLAFGLRTESVLSAAVEATHSLQLPRLRLGSLMEFMVPDIRQADRELIGRLRRVRDLVLDINAQRRRKMELVSSILPAARNEVFSSLQ